MATNTTAPIFSDFTLFHIKLESWRILRDRFIGATKSSKGDFSAIFSPMSSAIVSCQFLTDVSNCTLIIADTMYRSFFVISESEIGN